SVTQRTNAIVPLPALAVALIAATSCWYAPSPHLRSLNGSRPGKSSGACDVGTRSMCACLRGPRSRCTYTDHEAHPTSGQCPLLILLCAVVWVLLYPTTAASPVGRPRPAPAALPRRRWDARVAGRVPPLRN